MMSRRKQATTTCCHLCNSSIGLESSSSDFECRHRLCSKCISVSNGRPVCPTCSPSDILTLSSSSFPPPALPTHDQVRRMYSVDPDVISQKTPITPKIIDDDVRLFGEDRYDAKVDVKVDVKVVKDECQGHDLRRCSPQRRDRSPRDDASTWPPSAEPEPEFPHRCTSDMRRRLLTDYIRCLSEHAAAYRNKLHAMQSDQALFAESIAGAEAEVRRQARDWRRAVDRDEKALLLRLRSRMTEQTAEADAVRLDAEQTIGRMDALTRRIQDKMAAAPTDSAGERLYDIHCDVSGVLEERVGSMSFGGVSYLYGDACLVSGSERSSNLLGEIEFPPMTENYDDHSMFLSPPPLVRSVDTGHVAIVGMTVLDLRLYVLRSNSPEVAVYDSRSFVRRKLLSLLHLLSPMLVPVAVDVTSCPRTRTLFVADAANGAIYRLDPESGALLGHWKQAAVGVGGGGGALAVTSRGTLLVGTGSKVLECDALTGKTLRTVAGATLLKTAAAARGRGNRTMMHCPRHFLWRENTETLIVCDWKDNPSSSSSTSSSVSSAASSSPHTVYDVSVSGQTFHWHGNEPGSGETDLCRPGHVVGAPFDHVIVADQGNHRVKLLNARLEFVLNLVERRSSAPTRLVFEEETGRLYVGKTDGKIHVYRIVA